MLPAMMMTRLMCSKDRTQVEFVKRELSRAGILTEIRSNPLAAALRVARLELWVQDERDFATAVRLCAELQERFPVRQELASLDNDIEIQATVVDPPSKRPGRMTENAGRLPAPEPEALAAPPNNRAAYDAAPDDLEQASLLLNKEIEAMLAREVELEEQCEGLQSNIKALTESVTQSQAQLSREIAAREAAEKKLAALTDTHASAQRELRETQNQVRLRDQALAAAKADLQAKLQESRSSQSKAAEVTNELAKARNQIVAERQSRTAAEERAARLDSELKASEQKLAEQARLQQQLQTCTGNLNALRSKLRARNGNRAGS